VPVNTGGFTSPTPLIRAFCATLGRPRVIRAITPVFARAYMRPKTQADRDVMTRVRARVHTEDGARTAAALWRSFATPGHDLRAAAKDIAAPVLITWGARDLTAPVRWGRLVAKAIPGARFVTYPAGHVVFSSEPDAWLRDVVPFVEAAQRAERPAHHG
jgi:pimeloyl-ACP methyl ester carboxylesterase